VTVTVTCANRSETVLSAPPWVGDLRAVRPDGPARHAHGL